MISEDGTEYTVSKFPNKTKLGRVTDILEGRIRIQNDCDKQEKWSEINQMQLNQ